MRGVRWMALLGLVMAVGEGAEAWTREVPSGPCWACVQVLDSEGKAAPGAVGRLEWLANDRSSTQARTAP